MAVRPGPERRRRGRFVLTGRPVLCLLNPARRRHPALGEVLRDVLHRVISLTSVQVPREPTHARSSARRTGPPATLTAAGWFTSSRFASELRRENATECSAPAARRPTAVGIAHGRCRGTSRHASCRRSKAAAPLPSALRLSSDRHVREESLFHAGEEDDRKLETLRVVDRQQRNLRLVVDLSASLTSAA